MQRNDVERVAPKAAHSESTRTLYEALFSPHAVAVIGQSNDAAKTAGRPLKFLRQRGLCRDASIRSMRIVSEVLGERAWPSLEALPEVPEHVYIITAADAAMSALEACGKRRGRGRDRPDGRLRRGRFGRRGPRGSARRDRRRNRNARRRPVEPRHRQFAQRHAADRERRLRRAAICRSAASSPLLTAAA